MKKILTALVGLILVGGIGFGIWFFLQQKSAGTFHQVLEAADTAEITFTDGAKTYTKVVEYQPQVWLLTGMITDTSVPKMKCNFQGTIQFFAKKKPLFVQPAAINIEPQCAQIAFSYNGKIYHKQLLQEGIGFLQDILVEVKK